jgi:divalent metal cation (Fe/Co/Zn/Cd) transporter
MRDVSQTALNTSDMRTTRAEDARHGRRLEYFTIGWNCVEALVGTIAGVAAGSIALIGFAIDSLIESFSGAILLWRLQQHDRDEHRERVALKLVGWSLLLLALYVAVDAVKSLLTHEPPHKSIVGIALAAVSLIVMPLLAGAKRRVAARLDSRALHADSRQTDICAYLSVVLLLGLSLNALFGWWWADPVAALGMVPVIAHEGIKAFRGEGCGGYQPKA